MPGGFTQPKPPPSMIAAEVASHRACRSSSVNSVTRSIRSCAGSGGTSSARGRSEVSAMASGCPAKEIAEDSDTDLLALLDMELCAGPVARGHQCHYRPTVIGHRDGLIRIAARQRVAMHEIDVIARL